MQKNNDERLRLNSLRYKEDHKLGQVRYLIHDSYLRLTKYKKTYAHPLNILIPKLI